MYPTSKNKHHAYTLIEFLIAVCLFSISSVAILSYQLKSMQITKQSYNTTLHLNAEQNKNEIKKAMKENDKTQ